MPDKIKTEEKNIGENVNQQQESTGTEKETKEAKVSSISLQETKPEVNGCTGTKIAEDEGKVPLDKYLRLAADFDNYRKRSLRERNEFLTIAFKNFILELLPVIDDFDRAMEHSGNIQSVDSFVEGIRLVHTRLMQTLNKLGVTTWDSNGEKFTPEKHHALSRIISDTIPENTVVGEIRRGYMVNGIVIRPAEVIVSSAPEVSDDKNTKSSEKPQSDSEKSQTTSTE